MNAGDRALFRYSGGLTETHAPEIAKYHLRTATIVRPLTADEADFDDVGPMHRIRFDDGREDDAFDDELETVR